VDFFCKQGHSPGTAYTVTVNSLIQTNKQTNMSAHDNADEVSSDILLDRGAAGNGMLQHDGPHEQAEI
jgi:hypothetical protein